MEPRRVYSVYVLQSVRDGNLYVGSTNNLTDRLQRHARGQVRSTRHRQPMKLLHVEEHSSRRSAMQRERHLKSPQGGSDLKRQLLGKQYDKRVPLESLIFPGSSAGRAGDC